jgi:hypothetical protein
MVTRVRYRARTCSLLCERTVRLGGSPSRKFHHACTFRAPAFFASMHARGSVQREVTRRPVACRRGEA